MLAVVTLAVVLGIGIGLYALRDTPARSYEQIIASAQAGEWGQVWDRIDRRSQGRTEVGLEMLVAMAGAFNPENARELKALSGKDLFIRLASSRFDLQKQFINKEVESWSMDGNLAMLQVASTVDDVLTRHSVEMVYEDDQWKLSLPKLGESEVAATQPSDEDFLDTSPSANAAANKNGNADFRRVNWGMSRKEVTSIEESKPSEESSEALAYRVQIANMDCSVVYRFVSDKLVQATVMSNEQHSNNNLYLDDFENLKSALKNKYGPPKDEDTIWSDDLYRKKRDQWGMAVASGRMSSYATWTTATSDIYAVVRGDNFNVFVGVQYASRALKPLLESATQQQEEDAL